MNNEHRFSLERKPGTRHKTDCPFCGQRRCFTRYIDNVTGEYLSEECGKCDHENSCQQVNYPPRDYFRDHPWVNQRDEHPIIAGRRLVLSQRLPARPLTTPRIEPQTEFFPQAWVEESMQRTSTFRQWFEHLPFPEERVQKVLKDYRVGGTKDDVIRDGINYGPAVIFWQIDEQGRVHDGKLMAYHPDGHRVAGWCNWVRSKAEKCAMGPQLEHTDKVFFGQHLLPLRPDATVCIVESEKTALFCALIMPEYIWLATGGCGNLQSEKLKVLRGRKVVVWPDSGEYDKWRERVASSGLNDIRVENKMEQYPPNTDIADVLLQNLSLH